MSIQFKKYRSVRSEHFDDFLKACGVNDVIRKILVNTTSTVQLVQKGESSYSFNTESTLRTTSLEFILNMEFEEDTMDGRKVKCVVTFEGNRMIQQQSGENAIRVEREFTDDELIAKCTIGDVVATRWYKAIE